MARSSSPLAAEFRRRVLHSTAVAKAGEIARAEAAIGSATYREFHLSRLETLYEIAFLRVFVAWETFLEETFVRYLRGFTCHGAMVQLNTGSSYARTLRDARASVLSGNQYVLWHNPQKVIARSKRFFNAGPHEVILGSYLSNLESLASIRHRIAHEHADAKRQFDRTTLAFTGRRYRGSSAGRFLRDDDRSVTPSVRWLLSLSDQLLAISLQIA